MLVKAVNKWTKNPLDVEQFLGKQVTLPGKRSVKLTDYVWDDAVAPFVKNAANGPRLSAWLGQEVLPSDSGFAAAILAQGGHSLGTKQAAWIRDLKAWYWIPCQDRMALGNP